MRRRGKAGVCRGDQPARLRAAGATGRQELADIEKKIRTVIAAIEEGDHVRGMSDGLRELEPRQDELGERLRAPRQLRHHSRKGRKRQPEKATAIP